MSTPEAPEAPEAPPAPDAPEAPAAPEAPPAPGEVGVPAVAPVVGGYRAARQHKLDSAKADLEKRAKEIVHKQSIDDEVATRLWTYIDKDYQVLKGGDQEKELTSFKKGMNATVQLKKGKVIKADIESRINGIKDKTLKSHLSNKMQAISDEVSQEAAREMTPMQVHHISQIMTKMALDENVKRSKELKEKISKVEILERELESIGENLKLLPFETRQLESFIHDLTNEDPAKNAGLIQKYKEQLGPLKDKKTELSRKEVELNASLIAAKDEQSIAKENAEFAKLLMLDLAKKQEKASVKKQDKTEVAKEVIGLDPTIKSQRDEYTKIAYYLYDKHGQPSTVPLAVLKDFINARDKLEASGKTVGIISDDAFPKRLSALLEFGAGKMPEKGLNIQKMKELIGFDVVFAAEQRKNEAFNLACLSGDGEGNKVKHYKHVNGMADNRPYEAIKAFLQKYSGEKNINEDNFQIILDKELAAGKLNKAMINRIIGEEINDLTYDIEHSIKKMQEKEEEERRQRDERTRMVAQEEAKRAAENRKFAAAHESAAAANKEDLLPKNSLKPTSGGKEEEEESSIEKPRSRSTAISIGSDATRTASKIHSEISDGDRNEKEQSLKMQIASLQSKVEALTTELRAEKQKLKLSVDASVETPDVIRKQKLKYALQALQIYVDGFSDGQEEQIKNLKSPDAGYSFLGIRLKSDKFSKLQIATRALEILRKNPDELNEDQVNRFLSENKKAHGSRVLHGKGRLLTILEELKEIVVEKNKSSSPKPKRE